MSQFLEVDQFPDDCQLLKGLVPQQMTARWMDDDAFVDAHALAEPVQKKMSDKGIIESGLSDKSSSEKGVKRVLVDEPEPQVLEWHPPGCKCCRAKSRAKSSRETQ